jgi:hypothetical protein
LSTTPLIIDNEVTALDQLREALEGSYDSSVIELDFQSWPIFKFRVKGDRYNSTLTAPMMRSLLEIQTQLNNVYAEVVYGKSARNLTADERASLEIIFKVEQGSTDLSGDLSGFFTELGKNAMDKLSGGQVVGMVVGVAAIFGTYSIADTYLLNQVETQKLEATAVADKARADITRDLIKKFPSIGEMQKSISAAQLNLLKSVDDADFVELNSKHISKETLAEINKKERKLKDIVRKDASYKVASLKHKDDYYFVELQNTLGGKGFTAKLFKGHLNMAEMDQILKAFTLDTPIQLNVVARVRDDVISSGTIIGVNNQANGGGIEMAAANINEK